MLGPVLVSLSALYTTFHPLSMVSIVPVKPSHSMIDVFQSTQAIKMCNKIFYLLFPFNNTAVITIIFWLLFLFCGSCVKLFLQCNFWYLFDTVICFESELHRAGIAVCLLRIG